MANPFDNSDRNAAKVFLEEQGKRLQSALQDRGVPISNGTVIDWTYSAGWVHTNEATAADLPSVNLWLDKCQDGQTYLFYCGVGTDAKNAKSEILKIIDICAFDPELETEFTDDSWTNSSDNVPCFLGRTIPGSLAMCPIMDTSSDKDLGCAVGLYQHITEPYDEFYSRALEFVIFVFRALNSQNLDSKARLKAAQQAEENGDVDVKTGTRNIFARSPEIARWARDRAKGKCEACDTVPFQNHANEPYLEVHHLVPRAEGGPDTMVNVAAICANCHREIHYGIDGGKRIKALQMIVPEAQRNAVEAAG